MAFEGLSRSYFELRNYDNAIYIASQGSEAYPQNWNMVVIGVESCLKTGNEKRMETFLDKAIAMRPDHTTLIEYKGKMYERTDRPEKAAKIFAGLHKANPQSLDYACHYGFNLYNAAIATHTRIAESGDTTGMALANAYLTAAVPVLQEILDSSPYAINVAHALAQCHNLTGDAEGLRKANEALTALRAQEVTASTPLQPESDYMPTLNFTPVQTETLAATKAGQSDVDINIPITDIKRPNTYAVIIGNENYKYFSDVAYAKRDGATFAEYCQKVLGIPKDNIRERYDATLSEIREPLRYLEEKTRMNPDKLDIIFYYAGHGVPDVSRGTAHLLPTDASGTDFESCFELEQLYARLDDMPTKSVTVFLDACFSGATRGNEMLFTRWRMWWPKATPWCSAQPQATRPQWPTTTSSTDSLPTICSNTCSSRKAPYHSASSATLCCAMSTTRPTTKRTSTRHLQSMHRPLSATAGGQGLCSTDTENNTDIHIHDDEPETFNHSHSAACCGRSRRCQRRQGAYSHWPRSVLRPALHDAVPGSPGGHKPRPARCNRT